MNETIVEAGIIPARAGFTRQPARRPRWPLDHPRSRGVYALMNSLPGSGFGSSPLARGLRRLAQPAWASPRIIPARAGFTRTPTRSVPSSPDHPRSRGVYGTAAASWSRDQGSSPLARGLHWCIWAVQVPSGIIPARAGFTPASRRRWRCARDHPRSRGVYPAASAGVVQDWGSSPLARGLHRGQISAQPVDGIIPARAGFTGTIPTSTRRAADHPRSRGVYSAASGRRSRAPGSSPLARGLRRRRRLCGDGGGIIPARAGFTRLVLWSCWWVRDHPRSRGVYQGLRSQPVGSEGSSPLARGLRALPVPRVLLGGIIPARAGFTAESRGNHAGASGSSPLARGLPRARRPRTTATRIIPARAGFTCEDIQRAANEEDHPRSRGVYPADDPDAVRAWGSSPLARGLRPPGAAGPAGRGIIPARAGFTDRRGGRPGGDRDHPRSRGVYMDPAVRSALSPGSSPLARGLRRSERRAHSRVRIIPARAGFTLPLGPARARQGDHPRSRGVYTTKSKLEGMCLGSSPLARGLPPGRQVPRLGDRIIPARAGFTRSWHSPRS